MMDVIAQLTKISKGFTHDKRQQQIINNLSLTLHQGEKIALTGASGCGKSTLLNLIAGFATPDKGTLSLMGLNTQAWLEPQWSQFRRENLGVIFQQFNLLTPLNVQDNIRFPLNLLGKKWDAWCDHLIETLALTELLHRHVEQLSGGQQQRVAIARALAHQPKLILADEPTGNLDENTADNVMALLSQLTEQANSSILLVTHSNKCAAYMERQWQLHLGQIVEHSPSIKSQQTAQIVNRRE